MILLFLGTSCTLPIKAEAPLRVESPAHIPPDKPKVIWVVTSRVDRDWQLPRQIAGWNKAKYVDFKLTDSCPVASPCVLISEINTKYAGEADFATGESKMQIRLARDLLPREKPTTMCHELGHILGHPHVKSSESCMNDLGYLVPYPTASDIAVVDTYGQWNWYKASEYSGS